MLASFGIFLLFVSISSAKFVSSFLWQSTYIQRRIPKRVNSIDICSMICQVLYHSSATHGGSNMKSCATIRVWSINIHAQQYQPLKLFNLVFYLKQLKSNSKETVLFKKERHFLLQFVIDVILDFQHSFNKTPVKLP